MLRKAFAKTLKLLRTSAGFSQEELGARADLHRTYVSQLERGLKSPTLESVYSLCAVLKVPVPEFLAKVDGMMEAARKDARASRR